MQLRRELLLLSASASASSSVILPARDELEQRFVEPDHAERAAALHEVRQLEQLVVADQHGERQHAGDELDRRHHAAADRAGNRRCATIARSAPASDARTCC